MFCHLHSRTNDKFYTFSNVLELVQISARLSTVQQYAMEVLTNGTMPWPDMNTTIQSTSPMRRELYSMHYLVQENNGFKTCRILILN